MSIPVSISESVRWYCLRSQVKREHIAAANLRERVEVEVFSPRVKASYNSRRGLAINATEPLFPGYLFARFAYPSQVRHVMSTAGVSRIVAFGGRPPPVADKVIEYLRQGIADAAQIPATPVLEEGTWVKILSGCFQFIEGRVLHFDAGTERVRLLLTLLGSEVQVSMAAQRVALLDEPRPNYPSSLMTQDSGTSARVHCAA